MKINHLIRTWPEACSFSRAALVNWIHFGTGAHPLKKMNIRNQKVVKLTHEKSRQKNYQEEE